MNAIVWETSLPGVQFLNRGKVRDLYEVGDRLLIVATDRLSAFDVVLPTPIPDKGRVLTQLSLFWFDLLRDVIPNHVLPAADFPPELAAYRAQLDGRSMLCQKQSPCRLSVSCVATYPAPDGRIIAPPGKSAGFRCRRAFENPSGCRKPFFTPSTKATAGHDENISFDEAVARIGGVLGELVRAVSLEIYKRAAAYAEPRGIISGGHKFEFGLAGDQLIGLTKP